MRLLRYAAFAVASAPLFFTAACGDTVDDMAEVDSGSHSDAATNDSGSDAGPQDSGPTTDGGIIFQNDETITVTETGGFTAGAPDGSVCQPADTTLTYVIATSAFTWKICELEDGGLYGYRNGNRTLTSSEVSTLQSALGKVTIDKTLGCGADKPLLKMVVTSPSALTPTEFEDQFYHCTDDGKTYVDGLDEVVNAASNLAH